MILKYLKTTIQQIRLLPILKSNRTKHNLVKYAFVKDIIDNGLIKSFRVYSCRNKADKRKRKP